MELQDLLDAINAKLIEKWPNRTVYIDVCPVDFVRPSFWLTVEQYTQTDANRLLVKREVRLRLTIYDEKDEHYESSWRRLFPSCTDGRYQPAFYRRYACHYGSKQSALCYD